MLPLAVYGQIDLRFRNQQSFQKTHITHAQNGRGLSVAVGRDLNLLSAGDVANSEFLRSFFPFFYSSVAGVAGDEIIDSKNRQPVPIE